MLNVTGLPNVLNQIIYDYWLDDAPDLKELHRLADSEDPSIEKYVDHKTFLVRREVAHLCRSVQELDDVIKTCSQGLCQLVGKHGTENYWEITPELITAPTNKEERRTIKRIEKLWKKSKKQIPHFTLVDLTFVHTLGKLYKIKPSINPQFFKSVILTMNSQKAPPPNLKTRVKILEHEMHRLNKISSYAIFGLRYLSAHSNTVGTKLQNLEPDFELLKKAFNKNESIVLAAVSSTGKDKSPELYIFYPSGLTKMDVDESFAKMLKQREADVLTFSSNNNKYVFLPNQTKLSRAVNFPDLIPISP